MEVGFRTNSKSLFISKNEDELKLVPNWCKTNGWTLSAHSFLQFEKVEFLITSSFDVVFFASPRAAHYFFDAYKGAETFEIAVAGESTKQYVVSRGYKVAFCPTNGGDVTESSQLFSKWVGQRFVLFPTSTISQKSYTRFLRASQFEVISIYKTQISTQKIDLFDVYVFTSPSNVAGFLKSNVFPEKAKIIAWGETTFMAIKEKYPTAFIQTLHRSSEEELIQILK